MPTDRAEHTGVIGVPLAVVLATLRDPETQPEWVREIRTAEVLERDADGLPASARFTASTPVGSDEYTLGYGHRDDGLDWHLLAGKLQTAQNGRYSLRRQGADSTEVTFALEISHNLPLPGFLRNRVIKGLVTGTVTGLTRYLES